MPRTPTRPLRPRAPRALALTAALVALASCSGGDKGQRNAKGEVTKAGSWSVYDLRRGDCLAPAADVVEADTIKVVPCSSPHTQEVYAAVKHTADAFPGVASLQQFGDAQCTTQLTRSLGATTADGYFISYLLPSFDSWNKRGDKTVTCVLVFPTETAKTGSIVKSAIRNGKGEVGATSTTVAKGGAGTAAPPTSVAKGG